MDMDCVIIVLELPLITYLINSYQINHAVCVMPLSWKVNRCDNHKHQFLHTSDFLEYRFLLLGNYAIPQTDRHNSVDKFSFHKCFLFPCIKAVYLVGSHIGNLVWLWWMWYVTITGLLLILWCYLQSITPAIIAWFIQQWMLYIMAMNVHGMQYKKEDLTHKIHTAVNRSVASWWHYINGLVQERRNSIAIALELHLSCSNPSIWSIIT